MSSRGMFKFQNWVSQCDWMTTAHFRSSISADLTGSLFFTNTDLSLVLISIAYSLCQTACAINAPLSGHHWEYCKLTPGL